MGLFGGKEKEVDKELENAHKYVETIECNTKEELDKEIARRIESGRIIKGTPSFDVTVSNGVKKYSTLIMYDYKKEE